MPTYYRTRLLECQTGLGKTKTDIGRNATRNIVRGLAVGAGFGILVLVWGSFPKLGGIFGMLLGFVGMALLLILPLLAVGSIVMGVIDASKLTKSIRQVRCPACAAIHELLKSVQHYTCPCGATLHIGGTPLAKMVCPGCGIVAGVSPDFGTAQPLECFNCGATTNVQNREWRLSGATSACARCGRVTSETAVFCGGCLSALPQARRVEPDLQLLVAGRSVEPPNDASRRAVELLLAKNGAGTYADGRARAVALDTRTSAYTGDQFFKESYDALGIKDDGALRGIELLAAQAAEVAASGMTAQAVELIAHADRLFARFLRGVLAALANKVQDVALFDKLPATYLPRRREALDLIKAKDPALASAAHEIDLKLEYEYLPPKAGELVQGRVKDVAPLRKAIEGLERSTGARGATGS